MYISVGYRRTSPFAKIFLNKVYEDYNYSYAISKHLKRILVMLLLALNFVFNYFAVLMTYKRSVEFQHFYVKACVIQFFLDIIVFDAVKCFFICYYVPLLASKSVIKALNQIKSSINSIPIDFRSSISKFIVLDVPLFLFASTSLTRNYPSLIESSIINAYHTHLPVRNSNELNCSNYCLSADVLVRFSSNAAVLLRWIAIKASLIPVQLQKILLHLLQPLLLCATVFLCLSFSRNVAALASVIVVLIVLCFSLVYLLIYEPELSQLIPSSGAVKPVSKPVSDLSMDIELGNAREVDINLHSCANNSIVNAKAVSKRMLEDTDLTVDIELVNAGKHDFHTNVELNTNLVEIADSPTISHDIVELPQSIASAGTIVQSQAPAVSRAIVDDISSSDAESSSSNYESSGEDRSSVVIAKDPIGARSADESEDYVSDHSSEYSPLEDDDSSRSY